MLKANDIRQYWTAHRTTILRFAVVVMAMVALIWLSYQFWRLLFQTGYWGAIDLRMFRSQSRRWFDSHTIFQTHSTYYPPAAYVFFWLMFGWLDESPARIMWGITTIGALALLIYLIVIASRAETRLERVGVALIPLAMYATGANIGNGQLILHLLSLMVAGILILTHRQSWWMDLLAAALIILSLIKPTITAPFFWIVLFVPNRWRPPVLVIVGYLALNFVALLYRPQDLSQLFQQALATNLAAASAGGTSNVSIWLAGFGLGAWILPAAIFILAILGIWVWRQRQNDLWVLLGVTAVTARLWVYHSWYDDVLLLLPMIALFRIARGGARIDNRDLIAGALFALLLIFSLAPGGLYLFPAPFNELYLALQVIVWLAVLAFLVVHAHDTQSPVKLTPKASAV